MAGLLCGIGSCLVNSNGNGTIVAEECSECCGGLFGGLRVRVSCGVEIRIRVKS